MNRSKFGSWGAELSREDFACALAAVGVMAGDEAAVESLDVDKCVRTLRRVGNNIIPLRVQRIESLCARIPAGQQLASAGTWLSRWRQFESVWRQHGGARPALVRIEIDDSGPAHSRAELGWWALETLSHGLGQGIDGIYLRRDLPDRPIAWEWPLRIGVLSDAGSEVVAQRVEQIPWPELVKLVRPDVDGLDCDLLLLPDDLRGSLARVLATSRRLQADCVVVMRGTGFAGNRVMTLVDTMRAEVLCGGVAIAQVTEERQQGWLTALVETLSHDCSLDLALAHVRGEGSTADLPVAHIVGSRRLMRAARLSSFADRLGQQLRKMAARPASASQAPAPEPEPEPDSASPPPPFPLPEMPPSVPVVLRSPAARLRLETIGKALQDKATRGEWMHETGDAYDVMRMREIAHAEAGWAVPVGRAGAEPPAERRTDERCVNAYVYELSGDERQRVHGSLQTERAYELELLIARPRPDAIVAPAAFPSDTLPESDARRTLDVFFVPLVRNAQGRLHTPERGSLHLPVDGDSTVCRLTFRTHGVTEQYRARIVIAHENRVLQTWLLVSDIGVEGQPLTLQVENVLSPTLDPAALGRGFDLAIVANDSGDGVAGFTTLADGHVAFNEPDGLKGIIAEVKKLLSQEASFPDTHESLDDPELLKLLRKLATYGKSIPMAIADTLMGNLPDGARIQVVEARSGAWLPLEIFYSGKRPKEDASMCPNAAKALRREDGISHDACPYRDSPDHHCPMRFWGLSAVIERQPPTGDIPPRDYTISMPTPSHDRLDILRRVLIGASQKVRKQDVDDPGGIVEMAHAVAETVDRADGWEAWERAIDAGKPSLLLLLPHSLADETVPGISALEIGNSVLSYPDLEQSYVSTDPANAPVVLLIGCSTSLTETPFLNFVEAFKRRHAALVIGTLATIRGRRAVAFVTALLAGMKSAAGTERTFGEVFLETKRKLMADGDGFVMSLTAYGDTGWRFGKTIEGE